MSLQISDAELQSTVAKIFDQPAVTILQWDAQPLSVGFSSKIGAKGLYRVTGTAQHDNATRPWSLVVKIMEPGGALAADEPKSWAYWKREAMVNQSGILNTLPGGISAPRCFNVTEKADRSYWIWMEEIQTSPVLWTMARYHLAAQHLGEFNGAYLAGYPLPSEQPWMLWGRTRQWWEIFKQLPPQTPQHLESPLGKRWFGKTGYAQFEQAWSRYSELLDSFEKLPVCFCHHDAFRNNLLDRQHSDGSHETVLVDWSLAGLGRVGEEIGTMLMMSLLFLNVSARDANEFDQAIFDGYIKGLKIAGWSGSSSLVRLGYLTNSFMLYAVFCRYHLPAIQHKDGIDSIETLFGKSIDEIIAQYAELLPFSLNLYKEAVGLADELKI